MIGREDDRRRDTCGAQLGRQFHTVHVGQFLLDHIGIGRHPAGQNSLPGIGLDHVAAKSRQLATVDRARDKVTFCDDDCLH